YGLYTAGGNLISRTVATQGEAVKIAVDRLKPQFNNLLAAKWLNLTLNEFSSRLRVRATLMIGEQKQAVSWQRTTALINNQAASTKKTNASPVHSSIESNNNLPLMAKGTDLRLSLDNSEDRQLYAVVLGIDCDSNIYALYIPNQAANTEGNLQSNNVGIASGTEAMIPPPQTSWKWKVPESLGINTLYVVFAVAPFAETLRAFATQQNYKFDQQQILNVTNPVALIKALIQDLHNASAVLDGLVPNDDVYALNVDSWATLNFIYEVTNS
ncbi:MAG: hypothetical protein AAFY16_02335, partial [Cyanobacteria bacterium J06642_3]